MGVKKGNKKVRVPPAKIEIRPNAFWFLTVFDESNWSINSFKIWEFEGFTSSLLSKFQSTYANENNNVATWKLFHIP